MPKIYLLCFVLLLPFSASAQQNRHFTFRYAFTVRNIQPGQKIEVWFPLAHSDQFQDVKVVSMSCDLPPHKTHEARYGNSMVHAIWARAVKDEYKFDVQYDIVRHERIALPRKGIKPHQLKVTSKREVDEYLGPDKLVPVKGKLADIAAQQVQGHTDTLDRARTLYYYVFHTMRYDKSGTGWGRGDAEWACDSKRGNCTDFHSVFISMARSQHIAARFEIGFPLPASKPSGEIAGYHCWAEFYDPRYGWVPVDISEAWKDPTKEDYFFGAHDANRVQFSVGRDLVLNPPQAGESLNYFVYPYVEVDGKKWENVSNQFSFADAGTSTTVATSK